MPRSRRTTFGLTVTAAVLLIGASIVWMLRGPAPGEVRRTVITTLQNESPASFLVTGTLTMTTEVQVDSSVYLTPDWLTAMLQRSSSGMLSMMEGTAHATVRVPGRVSYGIEVKRLTADQIEVRTNGRVRVTLPPIVLHSVEPNLSRLQVRTGTTGWMRLLPSDAPTNIRQAALASVEDALRQQARVHIDQTTQPRIHTAEALANTLRPALRAAGVSPDGFDIRINEHLVYTPPLPTSGDAPASAPSPRLDPPE
mgnify:CR=1 FL=1